MKIRVIDLETTGEAPPEHGVCEIGWCDVASTKLDLALDPCGWEVGLPEAVLVNPGRPMPPETAAVHHIIDEDVADAPRWEEVWPAIIRPGDDVIAAFAAHSAKFERKFISDEMTAGAHWICTYKCGLRLWPDAPLHSNQGLRYWRKPTGLNRDLARLAHRAGPDAYVTAFHVRDLLEMASLADLVRWSNEPALQVVCHIGKQRGMKWREVDIGFLYWLLDKDFDEDVLFTARTEIERREHEHPVDVEEEDVDQSEGLV